MCFLRSNDVHKGLGKQRDLRIAKVTQYRTNNRCQWCLQEEKNTGNTLGNHQPTRIGILGNNRLLPATTGGTPHNLWWARLENTILLPVTPAVTQNGTGGTNHTRGEH